jgi:hypothetical protein
MAHSMGRGARHLSALAGETNLTMYCRFGGRPAWPGLAPGSPLLLQLCPKIRPFLEQLPKEASVGCQLARPTAEKGEGRDGMFRDPSEAGHVQGLPQLCCHIAPRCRSRAHHITSRPFAREDFDSRR